MTDPEPSSSAVMAAAARAAHLLVDRPPYIFADTLAADLLGAAGDEPLGYQRTRGGHPILAAARAQVICRSRYAEDRLAASGLTQYAILGAGLDSFALRSPLAGRIRTFEIDHPATQGWKRRRLAALKLPVPSALTFLPVDLESDDLHDRLTAGGLDRSTPALVTWLGVSMYLTTEAIGRVLDVVSRLAPGSELIFDHMLPPELCDADGRSYIEQVGPITAERGEPWRTFLSPAAAADLLAGHRLVAVEQLGQRDLPGDLWDRTDALRPSSLSHLTRARVPGPR